MKAWQSDEALEKFRKHVREDDSGCLIWTGPSQKLGYGVFLFKNFRCLAHRFSYQLAKGFIGDGLEIDHLCRVPACVNPNHLEAVTHQVNIKRGVRFWQKCPHGDEFRYSANRTCTVCANRRRRELRAEKKEKQCLLTIF